MCNEKQFKQICRYREGELSGARRAMRPLIQLEAESRIRLRSSWRGSGGRFEQADGHRSAGSKERMRNSSAEALEQWS